MSLGCYLITRLQLNRALPYLVGNVVEILELEPDEGEEEAASGASTDTIHFLFILVRKTLIVAVATLQGRPWTTTTP